MEQKTATLNANGRGRTREFARLAEGHKRDLHSQSQGSSKDEATSFETCSCIDTGH